MISTSMQKSLAQRSAIREAFERANDLKRSLGEDQVFDFSIGNPSAPCPEGVQRALLSTAQSSASAAHCYMDSIGYADVREAVAQSLNSQAKIGYTARDVIMTTGAACALNMIMRAVLDPEDEVVVFLPCYPAYYTFAQNCNARIVSVPFDKATFLPDVSALAEALTPKTKIVIVNTPNNPTGLIYPHDLASQIADVLNDAQERFGHPIYLVSDEPYRDLVFEGKTNPIWPLLYSNAIVVYSFSKSASIAGERIGYLALPPKLAGKDLLFKALSRLIGDLGFVNAPATAQRMAKECVADIVDISVYDENRRELFGMLNGLGFEPVEPFGAFYMLLPAPSGTEAEFIENLAQEGIIAVGGQDFGCPGFVRLSFCVSPDVIKGSAPRFEKLALSYGIKAN